MTTIDEMVLIPRPRSTVESGEGAPVADLLVRDHPTPSLPRQGFRITSSAEGVDIDHRDAAGLRYARSLLDQVIDQCPGGRLPGFTIEDSPDIAVRGYVLDISRDRVPTRATLERLVELCALARINQLQLYVEHTFAHPEHRAVWELASPMTPAHLSWLDLHCSHHGIELVVNQNTFGHMERWLGHERYRHRAETPDGWDPVPGMHLPPSVLAPTADNAAFALELVRHQLDCVRSPQVHIGCDEPFGLGHGVSADDVAARGLGPVYVEHLRRLADPLLADGHRVQVWADVLARHPALAAELPPGIVPVAWCYETPTADGGLRPLPDAVVDLLARMGVDRAGFSGFGPVVAGLADHDVDFWVAPGTSAWNSLVGRVDNARANLVDAAETARAHGCGGLLVTDWGDHGHHQPPSVSFGPLVYGGAVAWGLDANRDLDLAAVLDRHVFADPSGCVSAALASLGTEWGRTGQEAVNASPLVAALFPDQPHLVLGRPDPALVADVVARIDGAIGELGRAAPACGDGEVVVRELTLAARMARHGAWNLLGDAGPSAAVRTEDMAELAEGHLVSWMDRSRPGGLSDSLARLDPSLTRRATAPT